MDLALLAREKGDNVDSGFPGASDLDAGEYHQRCSLCSLLRFVNERARGVIRDRDSSKTICKRLLYDLFRRHGLVIEVE